MVEGPKVNFGSLPGEEIKNITRFKENSSALSYEKNAEAEVVCSSNNAVAIDPNDLLHSEHSFLNEAVALSLLKGADEDLKDFVNNNPSFSFLDKAAAKDTNKPTHENRRSSDRETAELPAYSANDKTNINEYAAPQNLCINVERLEKDYNNVAWNSRRSMGEGSDMHRDLLTARTLTSTSEPQQETKNSQSSRKQTDASIESGYPTRSLPYSPADSSIFNPTKKAVVAPLKESERAVIARARVCYACSSINDFSCNFPQRGTTVKYCGPGHESCITKTVRGILSTDADFIVIRDCGNSCELASTKSLVDIHSCSVCNGDLCNSKPIGSKAFAFSTFSALFIFVITWGVKLAI